MKTRIYRCLLLIPIVFLSACASSPDSSNRSGILCLYNETTKKWDSDCLNPMAAKSEEVNRRVAIYNDHLEDAKHISCKKRKSLGSSFSRWRCYKNSSPAEDAFNAENFEDLIRKGSF